MTDPKLSYFTQNLTLVNTKMRFGEAGFDVDQQELTQVVDEVAFNLHKAYLDILNLERAILFGFQLVRKLVVNLR